MRIEDDALINNDAEMRFNPPWYLRGAMVQTLLNSARFRNRGTGGLELNSREKIVDAGNGVRLQGFLSEPEGTPPRGLVILLHGWEGSANSAYMVSTGRFFYDLGFSVFRLNMRDHGDSHHLNTGFFLGTMIEEAYSAVKEAVRQYGRGRSAGLAGFSMGANFCVRIARMASEEGYSGLRHVFAVNPPIDPLDSTRRVDRTAFIKKYFLGKWKRSLAAKQDLFPEIYDFSGILSLDACIPMTEKLLDQYTSFSSLEDYFSNYTLKEGYFDSMKIPFTLLMSEDDPIIPVSDFMSSPMSPSVRFILQKRGGHCGYIMNRRYESWYLGPMLRAFTEEKLLS